MKAQEIDSIMPQVGEYICFIGSNHTLTSGKYYEIRRIDYKIQLDFYVCIINDSGFEDWLPLVQFDLIE